MGVSVALVCKSMLGKAHTVMAEGGAAAALANKDSRDSWETHFRDTMKGGKYLNDWRMARIHAQEALDRIREFETWGAYSIGLARAESISGILVVTHTPGLHT